MHVAFCQLSVTFSCHSTLLSASCRHLCDCILSSFHAPVWVASAVFLNAALQAYLSNTDSSRTELFHWSKNRATWTLTSAGQNVFLASSIRHLLTPKCRVIQHFEGTVGNPNFEFATEEPKLCWSTADGLWTASGGWLGSSSLGLHAETLEMDHWLGCRNDTYATFRHSQPAAGQLSCYFYSWRLQWLSND